LTKALRFYLQGNSSTQINLSKSLLQRGWESSRFAWQADFNHKHLDFNEEAAQCLEFKHSLAKLVHQNCPQCMMTTYDINDDNWPEIVHQLAKEYYQNHDEQANLQWILKPSLLNNGQHIRIFQRLSDIERHFSQHNRLGGEHVLQRYINKPQLLRDDRKYSIRLFMVLTNYTGAFLYHQGYFNVALHPYTAADFNDLRPHLTNEHLSHEEANVIQIPANRFAHFSELFSQITILTRDVVNALRLHYPEAFRDDKRRQFALFGVDAMVDSTGRAWLLEFNHGPCFPVDENHPLQKHVYNDFWKEVVDNFVIPIGRQIPDYPVNENFVAL